MKRLVLIPLILCLSVPQYLVLSINRGFYSYKYSETTNLLYSSLAIAIGIILSFALNRFVMATFLILAIGILALTLGCAAMLYGSAENPLSQSYRCGFLVTCFTVGLIQPNLASFFGDQFISSSLNHFLGYVFINMIGICFSRLVSILFELQQLFGINCVKLNCYPSVYLTCLILSCIGLVILLLMYIGRKHYVINPLLHKPLIDRGVVRFKTFCSMFMPLIGFLLILFELEHDMFIQANELNRSFAGNFYIELFQLHIMYYFLILLCVPVALLMDVRKSKSFEPIIIGCGLICLANFYYGLLHWSAKECYNRTDIPIDPTKITLQIINGMEDMVYILGSHNLIGSVPYAHKEGPIRLTQNNFNNFIFDVYYYDTDIMLYLPYNISLSDSLLISVIFTYHEGFKYPERTYRVSSGFALLRLFCISENNYKRICIKGKHIEECPWRMRFLMKEVPADLYTLTYENVTFASYFLDSGSYSLFLYDSGRDISSLNLLTLISPFKFSIYWQFILYILLSIAKGMLFSAGLHITYKIGSEYQKDFYIGCLYLCYLVAWVLYLTLKGFFGFAIDELRNALTIMLVVMIVWLYYGYHHWSYIINRKESDRN